MKDNESLEAAERKDIYFAQNLYPEIVRTNLIINKRIYF